MTRLTKILILTGLTLILLIIAILFVTDVDFSSPKIQSADIKPFTIKTFEINNGWGYSLLIRNKEIIRQEMIPAIQQQSAFINQKDAYKAAVLMVGKLKKNKIPGLTKSEMANAGIKMP